VLVVSFEEPIFSGAYSVWAVNDNRYSIVGNVIIEFISWQNGNVLDSWMYPFEVSAQTSNLITNISISDIISGVGSRSSGFFQLTLQDSLKNVLSVNNYYLTSFTDVNLQSPTIKFSDPKILSPYDVSFNISSNSVTPFVYVQSNYSGFFSDNGFMLLPLNEMSLTFHSVSEITITANEFMQTLDAKSLYETYHH